MSVDEIPVGQYVKWQEVKDALDFPDDTNEEEMTTILKDANQDIETKLRPYAATLPIEDGTPEFKAAARAGVIYVNARWKEKKLNFELANQLDKRYEKKMADLIQVFKTKPTVRTKALVVSHDPRDEKLPLPTQYSTFVFDDYP